MILESKTSIFVSPELLQCYCPSRKNADDKKRNEGSTKLKTWHNKIIKRDYWLNEFVTDWMISKVICRGITFYKCWSANALLISNCL